MVKIIVIWFLVVALTIYAPAELTLTLFNQEVGLRMHPDIPLTRFYCEMAAFWGGYILAMIIVFIILVQNWLRGRSKIEVC